MRAILLVICVFALASCNGGGGSNVNASGKGSLICGSSSIYGKKIARVRSSSNSACGFGNAVEVYSVAGVATMGNTRMQCNTAKQLETWTRKSAIPAVRRNTNEQLASMNVWVSYACRNRSSGRRLSEHAKGNAVDIAGFKTNKGNTFTVAKDWRKGKYGRAMLQMKSGACGPFGVVLHPDNDRQHWNHFHFDTSNKSGGYRYCHRSG